MKTNLVIGLGEIGTAIKSILNCDGYDAKDGDLDYKKYDVIHICFPYFTGFEETVVVYKDFVEAELVIIHSTVPVGTTEKIGDFAIHSPVRGVHPHLEEGIRTFVKYFGGKRSTEAADQFPMLNFICCYDAKTTELMKLVDTTTYGINILLQKEIFNLCKKYGVDPDTVYDHANKTYNEGYEKLGMPQFKKYNLKDYPGPIGGHCIMPNTELFDSWMCELLQEFNKNL